MLDRSAIDALLPHGEGFTFLDSAVIEDGSASGKYKITGEECFAGAHFPGRFVFPAAIMVEAIGQLGIVYIRETMADSNLDPDSMFFIGSEDVSCRRQCVPGDLLELSVKLLKQREPLIVFSGTMHVGGQLVLKISSLTLSFSTKPSS